jgi:hypothetical protein
MDNGLESCEIADFDLSHVLAEGFDRSDVGPERAFFEQAAVETHYVMAGPN